MRLLRSTRELAARCCGRSAPRPDLYQPARLKANATWTYIPGTSADPCLEISTSTRSVRAWGSIARRCARPCRGTALRHRHGALTVAGTRPDIISVAALCGTSIKTRIGSSCVITIQRRRAGRAARGDQVADVDLALRDGAVIGRRHRLNCDSALYRSTCALFEVTWAARRCLRRRTAYSAFFCLALLVRDHALGRITPALVGGRARKRPPLAASAPPRFAASSWRGPRRAERRAPAYRSVASTCPLSTWSPISTNHCADIAVHPRIDRALYQAAVSPGSVKRCSSPRCARDHVHDAAPRRMLTAPRAAVAIVECSFRATARNPTSSTIGEHRHARLQSRAHVAGLVAGGTAYDVGARRRRRRSR